MSELRSRTDQLGADYPVAALERTFAKGLALRCPLCGSGAIEVLERVIVTDLCRLFKGNGSLDVVPEFGGVDAISYLQCQTCDLRFFHPPVNGSEAFYEWLQSLDAYYPVEKPEFEYARTWIDEHKKLLEVGCGAGAFGASLGVRKYIGLEFSAKAAAAARARGLTVMQETVEEHSRVHPGVYDVVCTFQVMEHVAEPGSFVRACTMALRPGGRLILSVPSADSFARNVHNFTLDLPPHHVTRWTDRCLRNLDRHFPLRLREIWHERLQPVHRRMYVSSTMTAVAYALTGRRVPAVDLVFFGRAVGSVTWKVSRLFAPVTGALFTPRGISATAVYDKLD